MIRLCLNAKLSRSPVRSYKQLQRVDMRHLLGCHILSQVEGDVRDLQFLRVNKLQR